ncbi:MAG: GNAT family N-acetyltransferase [Planctomycetota bacterium]|jgi:GNAT superfamily N-acetyltransferase|nr:GNAT family N-acetyltransferase [Planctomycetota bacterium]
MEIVEYQEKYKQYFIALNRAWVEKYFRIEPADVYTMNNVEKYLEKGGMIFFAVEGGKAIATCLIFPIGNDVWELSKLAADESRHGCGAGSAVFKACLDYAVGHAAKKITLESNQLLKPALHVYEKFGFRRVPLDPDSKYARADIRFEYAVPGMNEGRVGATGSSQCAPPAESNRHG